MALMTAGYYPAAYWPESYFPDDYWPDYGLVQISTPATRTLSVIAENRVVEVNGECRRATILAENRTLEV